MQNNRINKIISLFDRYKIDALLVSNPYNVYYVCGFWGLTREEKEAWVLLTKDTLYLFTDGRYIQEAQRLSDNKRVKAYETSPDLKLTDHIAFITKEKSINKIGFESENLTYLEYSHFTQKLESIRLIPLDNLLIRVRAEKEADEISSVKKACELSDKCFLWLSKTLKKGMSEKDIAHRIEDWVKKQNSSLSFSPLVAIDENTANPHYNTQEKGEKKIGDNSIILIDLGIIISHYTADQTRMFVTGAPPAQFTHAYDDLLYAYTQTLKYMQTVQKYKIIDSYCRKILIDRKYPTYPHSTGHGIGLEIHEYPKMSSTSADLKKEGHVVTLEPAIYMKGKFGVRIEDTLIIQGGKAKSATKFPRDLIRID